MHFNDGKADWWAAAAEHRVHPCGQSIRQMVGIPPNAQFVHQSRPVVEFSNHLASTSDPDETIGMFTMDWFDRKDGWSLVADCLPKAIRDFWPRLNRKARVKVGTNLAHGVDPKEILAALSDSDYDKQVDEAAAAADRTRDQELQCPVDGCMAAAFIGNRDKATKALLSHLEAVHPEYAKTRKTA